MSAGRAPARPGPERNSRVPSLRSGPAAAALVAVAALGCRGGALAPPGDGALPFTRALLAAGEDSDARAALEALGKIAGRVQDEMRRRPGEGRLEILNRTIFEQLAFAREIDDSDPRFMRLASVIDARRGSCLGLGALYLALGEWLGPGAGFAVHGVLVPGHFFVRVVEGGGAPRNAELLRRGEQMPESWYRERYQLPAEGQVAPAYLRPLTPAEVLAVFDYNVGNDLRRRGKLPAARSYYARAAAAFPQFAEAHASHGLVLHLTGDLPAAARAYEAARAANPTLPGLEKNVTLLREEMAGARK